MCMYGVHCSNVWKVSQFAALWREDWGGVDL